MGARNITFFLGSAANLNSRKWWLYQLTGSGIDEASPTALINGASLSAGTETVETDVPSNCLIEVQVEDTTGGNAMPKRVRRFRVGPRGNYDQVRDDQGEPPFILTIDDMSSTSSQSSSSSSSQSSSSSHSSSSQSSSSSSSSSQSSSSSSST